MTDAERRRDERIATLQAIVLLPLVALAVLATAYWMLMPLFGLLGAALPPSGP